MFVVCAVADLNVSASVTVTVCLFVFFFFQLLFGQAVVWPLYMYLMLVFRLSDGGTFHDIFTY